MKIYYIPMTKRRYKIETTMNSIVDFVASVKSTFIPKITFKLFIYVLNDGSKAETRNKVN